MDYYSVDSILEDEDSLKVRFKHRIDDFGHYIGPNTKFIKPGQAVELPYYLVSFLIQNDHCEVVQRPIDSIRDDLDAHSPIVDLNNSQFYSLNRDFESSEFLTNIFFERIGDSLKFLNKEDFSEDDISKMAYIERKYFIKARKTFKSFQDFYLRKNE